MHDEAGWRSLRRAVWVVPELPPKTSPEGTVSWNLLRNLRGWDTTVVTGAPLAAAPSHLRARVVPQAPATRAHVALALAHLVADTTQGWVREATRATLDELRKTDARVLVTRGNPVSTHFVGLRVKRAMPHVRWVACFSDPWTRSPFFRAGPLAPYWRRREAAILRQADRVVVTTGLTRQALRGAVDLEKVSVVPNSFDPADAPAAPPPERAGTTFVHVGNFYGPRDPFPLVRAFARYAREDPDARLVFVGNMGHDLDALRRAAEGAPVAFLGPRPRAEALGVLWASDVVIVSEGLLPPPSVFLPTKTIEALAAGKALLVHGPRGMSSALARASGRGAHAPTNDALLDAYREAAKGAQSAPSPRERRIAEAFLAPRCAARMDRVLARALEESP